MPVDTVLLTSAARTADTNSETQHNRRYRGLVLTVDVTAETDTATITPSVAYRDPASGKWEKIWTAAAGITAVGTHSYLLYPGAADADADVVEAVETCLPEHWRVEVAHADADSMTYSVGGCLLE